MTDSVAPVAVDEPEPIVPLSYDINDAFPPLSVPAANGTGVRHGFDEPGTIREAYLPSPSKPNATLQRALLQTILELCRGPRQHASLEEILLAHPEPEAVESEIAQLSATGHLQSGSDERGRYWILTGLGKGSIGF